MMIEKNSTFLSHVSWVLYQSGAKSNTNEKVSADLTHFSSLILLMSKLLQKGKCRWFCSTFCKSLRSTGEILIDKHNYEQPYYTLIYFCRSHEQTLMFHHFLE